MGQHSVSTSSSRLVRIKPNALRKAELNCSLQFSFSMCIELATTCDDPRRFSDEIGGRRKFFTIAAYSRESANQYNVCRWTKTGDELRRLATGSSLSSGRRRFNAQRKTELNLTQLNWTIQFSSVQLSWVQFAAVHWALVTRKYIKHDVVFYTLICGSADGRLRRVNAQMIRACASSICIHNILQVIDWLHFSPERRCRTAAVACLSACASAAAAVERTVRTGLESSRTWHRRRRTTPVDDDRLQAWSLYHVREDHAPVAPPSECSAQRRRHEHRKGRYQLCVSNNTQCVYEL